MGTANASFVRGRKSRRLDQAAWQALMASGTAGAKAAHPASSVALQEKYDAREALADVLSSLRVRHGMQQTEVANGLGWHQTQLGMIETGTRPVTLDSLVELSTYYGVDVSTFLRNLADKLDS